MFCLRCLSKLQYNNNSYTTSICYQYHLSILDAAAYFQHSMGKKWGTLWIGCQSITNNILKINFPWNAFMATLVKTTYYFLTLVLLCNPKHLQSLTILT